jgi:hypothetical protein
MVRLTGLDKKLFIVQHKMTAKEVAELKLPEEELRKLVQQNLYNKVIQLLFQATKVKQTVTEENDILWEYRMFMIGERDMWGLLMETCELSEEDRKSVIAECKRALGMFTP